MYRILGITLVIYAALITFGRTEGTKSIQDTFWLAYRHEVYRQPVSIAVTYLVKFDAAGRILMKPRRLLTPELNSNFFMIGISRGRGSLHLWTSERNLRTSFYSYITTRSTVSLRNLSVSTPEQVPIKHQTLSITNGYNKNFILFFKNNVLMAMGLTIDGERTREVWQISRSNDSIRGPNPVVSPDGRMAAFLTDEGLIAQRLDPNGRPTGVRNIVFPYNYNSINYISFTNGLTDNNRYLLIGGYYLRSGSCSGALRWHKLLVLDERSAKRRYLAFDRQEYGWGCEGPHVQIDPEGRFILIGPDRFGSGASELSRAILFQSLDSKGRPSRPVKPIVGHADLGFLMLMN